MITKQHFEALAEAFRDTRPDGEGITVSDPEAQQWGKDVASVAHVLQRINPRFDMVRFLRACQAPR